MLLTPKLTPDLKKNAIEQFEHILRRASDKGASDLHLKAGLPPIVRVNGRLYYLGEEAVDDHREVAASGDEGDGGAEAVDDGEGAHRGDLGEGQRRVLDP